MFSLKEKKNQVSGTDRSQPFRGFYSERSNWARGPRAGAVVVTGGCRGVRIQGALQCGHLGSSCVGSFCCFHGNFRALKTPNPHCCRFAMSEPGRGWMCHFWTRLCNHSYAGLARLLELRVIQWFQSLTFSFPPSCPPLFSL